MKNMYITGLLVLMVHTGLAMGASRSTDPQPGSFPDFASGSDSPASINFIVNRDFSGKIRDLEIAVSTEDIPALQSLQPNVFMFCLDNKSKKAASGISKYHPWTKWQYAGFMGVGAASAAGLSSLFTKLAKHYGLNVAPMHIYGGLGAFAAMCSLWGLYRFYNVIPDDRCTSEMKSRAFDMQTVEAAVLGFLNEPNPSWRQSEKESRVVGDRSIYTLIGHEISSYALSGRKKLNLGMYYNPSESTLGSVREQFNERERGQGLKWMSCGAAAALPLLGMAAKEYSTQRLLLN